MKFQPSEWQFSHVDQGDMSLFPVKDKITLVKSKS